MDKYDTSSFASVYEHCKRHNIKRWLLNGAREEDANTIRRAVEAMPDHRLARRFAEMLTRPAHR